MASAVRDMQEEAMRATARTPRRSRAHASEKAMMTAAPLRLSRSRRGTRKVGLLDRPQTASVSLVPAPPDCARDELRGPPDCRVADALALTTATGPTGYRHATPRSFPSPARSLRGRPAGTGVPARSIITLAAALRSSPRSANIRTPGSPDPARKIIHQEQQRAVLRRLGQRPVRSRGHRQTFGVNRPARSVVEAVGSAWDDMPGQCGDRRPPRQRHRGEGHRNGGPPVSA